MIKPPSKDFVDWCKKEPKKTHADEILVGNTNNCREFTAKHGVSYKDDPEFLNNAIKKVNFIKIRIAGAFDIYSKVIKSESRGFDYYIYELSTETRVPVLTLKKLNINNLRIDCRYEVKLDVEDCNIRRLTLTRHNDSAKQVHKIKLTVTNSNVGTLDLSSDAVHNLKMKGGCVLNISCPKPGEDNPFTGHVAFTRVFFPRNTKDYLLKDSQPYRNIKHHLKELGNHQNAEIFHPLELTIDRKEEKSIINKCISFLYEKFSDYGSSASRPLAWIFGTCSVMFLLIFFGDGAVIRASATLEGWETSLCTDFGMSLYLAFQLVVKPLGIFFGKGILTYKYGLLAILGMAQGFLSAIWIALFIFAVRRRFKLQ